ncbi:MAG: hypothetical protein JWQ66_4669 [Mucilaginibacter sp.]|nr:hypothetical protein [Mucilaginibacter sp.]
MLRRLASFFSVFACALFFMVAAHAQDATLARAKTLLDAKKAPEAFALLDPLEDARAGDPDFDYLLGIASIDSGHLTRGVFALERVIAVKPNFPEARAEIARAYFLMGENRAAREEFEAVKASNPPPTVISNVNQFLDALQARESGRNVTGISGYIEMGLGYDTNANAATTAGAFAIPAFGGTVFTNSTNGQQTHAWFASVGGGVSGRYRIDSEWALIGSATISERYNNKYDQFDTGYLTADGGVSWKRERNEIVGLLQTQESRVDNNVFRRANGGTLQYRYSLNDTSEMSVYGQHSRQVYPGQRQRDTLRDVLGVAYAKTFEVKLAPTLYGGVYGGQEVETQQNQGFGNFGNRLNGLRLGGQISITPKLSAFINGSYEDRVYRGPDPLFVDTRHDKQSDVRIGANYVVGRNLTITPSAAWTDNRSNIIIYDYSRWITMVNLRYDFR